MTKESRKEIVVCRDPDEVKQRTAELFVRLANESVSATAKELTLS